MKILVALSQASEAELLAELERRRKDDALITRQARNNDRVLRATERFRLWAWRDSGWLEMTKVPLLWYDDKEAGAKTARTRISG